MSWCSGAHWWRTAVASHDSDSAAAGSPMADAWAVSHSVSSGSGTSCTACAALPAQSLRGLLVDDGVHDGVGGPAEPDAVVDERGDVAAVSSLHELDVVEGGAAQFGNADAGTLQGLQSGGEFGQHLPASLADHLGVFVVAVGLVVGGQGVQCHGDWSSRLSGSGSERFEAVRPKAREVGVAGDDDGGL